MTIQAKRNRLRNGVGAIDEVGSVISAVNVEYLIVGGGGGGGLS